MSSIRILDAGQEIHLPTKTAEIVRRVVEVSGEIEGITSGRVTFHFKGRSVIAELTKHFRPARLEECEKV